MKHGDRVLILATYGSPTGPDAPSSWVILDGNVWNTSAYNDIIIPRDADPHAVEHDRRVTELLEHNNELLERARAAEAKVKALQSALLAAAQVGAALWGIDVLIEGA